MPNRSARIRLSTFGFALLALPGLGSAAEAISLAGVSAPADVQCPRADGAYVAFLLPGKGSLLLGTQTFPGGRRVGKIEGQRLRVSVDGLGDYDMPTTDSHAEPLPVWGMMDRSLEVGQRTGCFSFGDREFSSVDDLKTYLHWVLRDLFFRLRAADNTEPLDLRFADRKVSLEISTPGHRPATLQTREAGTVGLRLPDSEGVLLKDEPFFGEGTAQEVAFVTVGREAPGMTATDPVLEIRTRSID
jgi:hypothetical protein